MSLDTLHIYSEELSFEYFPFFHICNSTKVPYGWTEVKMWQNETLKQSGLIFHIKYICKTPQCIQLTTCLPTYFSNMAIDLTLWQPSLSLLTGIWSPDSGEASPCSGPMEYTQSHVTSAFVHSYYHWRNLTSPSHSRTPGGGGGTSRTPVHRNSRNPTPVIHCHLGPASLPLAIPEWMATRLPRKGGYLRFRGGLSLLPRIFRTHPHLPLGCQLQSPECSHVFS